MEHRPGWDWAAFLPIPSLAHPWRGRCWLEEIWDFAREDTGRPIPAARLCAGNGDELVASPQAEHPALSPLPGTGDKSGDTAGCEGSFSQGCAGGAPKLLSFAQT